MRKKTRIIKIVFIIMLVINLSISIKSFELKEVLRIGSDKLNYEFFLITAVDVDEKLNIYLVDSKGCFVRKYTKDGNFVGEVGRKGNGPGEFLYPRKIFVKGNSVFIGDFTGRKIVTFNDTLKVLKKEIKLYKPPYDFFVYKNKIYFSTISKNSDNIFFVFNMEGKKIKEFFNIQPYFLKNRKKDPFYIAYKIQYAIPTTSFNIKKHEIALSFNQYSKNYKLYIIDFSGKIKKTINLTLEKGFDIPSFYFQFPVKYPKRYTLIGTDSIHYYKDRYIFLHYEISKVKRINNKERTKDSSYIVIVDINKGKIIDKKKIPSGLRIFKIKGDYLYAKNFDDDIEKLHVYKIEGIE